MSGSGDAPPDHYKIKVILSICRFFSEEIKKNLSRDAQESLTVAVQCLEAAYNIDYDNLIRSTTNVPDLWTAFIRVNEESPAEAEIYKQKGNEFMGSNCFQEAVNSYTTAIQLNPRNPIYYCNRAAAYSRMADYNNCIADCQSAVKLDANYTKAYGRLGLAYMSINSYADAVEAYGAALRLDPTNHMYKQNFDTAMEHLRSNILSGNQSTPNPSTASTAPAGAPIPPSGVQAVIDQLLNSPNLLTMASQMLSDESVRNAMTGLMEMRAQNSSNPAMESLLLMGQQLNNQMQAQHPEFLENLRQQFASQLNNSSDPDNTNANQQPDLSEKNHPGDKTGNA